MEGITFICIEVREDLNVSPNGMGITHTLKASQAVSEPPGAVYISGELSVRIIGTQTMPHLFQTGKKYAVQFVPVEG